MRAMAAVVFGLMWSACLADADADAAAKLVKQDLIAQCEGDEDCAYAVKMQFDSCHRRFRKEWQAYMDASGSEEDRHLAVYAGKLTGCIVDTNGEPYFNAE